MIKVARAGTVIGEYPEADMPALIRAKTILPTDDYWAPGMSNWAKVLTYQETSPAQTPPPPLPKTEGANNQSRGPVPAWLMAAGGIVLIIFGITAFYLIIKEPVIDPKAKEEFIACKAKADSGNLQSQMELNAAKRGHPEVFYKLSEFYRWRRALETSEQGIRFNGGPDYQRSYAYARLAWSNKDYGAAISVGGRVIMHSAEEHMSAAEVAEAKKLAASIRDRIFEEKGYRVPLIE
jgi:hypothetical protein